MGGLDRGVVEIEINLTNSVIIRVKPPTWTHAFKRERVSSVKEITPLFACRDSAFPADKLYGGYRLPRA